MFDQKNTGSIACFLNCLGVLEHKNSQLFEELSNRTTVSEVKAHLLKISQGNKDQSKVLLGLGDQLGCSQVKGKECKRKLKPVCDPIDSVFKKVKKKKRINSTNFPFLPVFFIEASYPTLADS